MRNPPGRCALVSPLALFTLSRPELLRTKCIQYEARSPSRLLSTSTFINIYVQTPGRRIYATTSTKKQYGIQRHYLYVHIYVFLQLGCDSLKRYINPPFSHFVSTSRHGISFSFDKKIGQWSRSAEQTAQRQTNEIGSSFWDQPINVDR